MKVKTLMYRAAISLGLACVVLLRGCGGGETNSESTAAKPQPLVNPPGRPVPLGSTKPAASQGGKTFADAIPLNRSPDFDPSTERLRPEKIQILGKGQITPEAHRLLRLTDEESLALKSILISSNEQLVNLFRSAMVKAQDDSRTDKYTVPAQPGAYEAQLESIREQAATLLGAHRAEWIVASLRARPTSALWRARYTQTISFKKNGGTSFYLSDGNIVGYEESSTSGAVPEVVRDLFAK
jgi:hypothetical protein